MTVLGTGGRLKLIRFLYIPVLYLLAVWCLLFVEAISSSIFVIILSVAGQSPLRRCHVMSLHVKKTIF